MPAMPPTATESAILGAMDILLFLVGLGLALGLVTQALASYGWTCSSQVQLVVRYVRARFRTSLIGVTYGARWNSPSRGSE